MDRPKYLEIITERISKLEKGTVFITSDFLDIASSDVVNKALSRLDEEGIIKRVLRGVYECPKYSELLGEYVATNPEKVVSAIARNYGWTIAPCGDTALNLLQLSTQVPAVWSYVSDGPYREYSYDKVTIKFKHAANKETSGLSYITTLVIQAIKAIGKDEININNISKLKSVLSDGDKSKILIEAQGTTAWVYEVIKKICNESCK